VDFALLFSHLISLFRITKCGHNFCKPCIDECLNRRHQCPCCNRKTEPKDLMKNIHGDRLIRIILEEKEKASKGKVL